MKGLEATELKLSEVLRDNESYRIDAEYFKHQYLEEDRNRGKFSNIFLGEFTFVTDGQHGYHVVDEQSEIRHLTAKNAKGFFANDIDADRIAKWVDDNNKRSSLEKGDVILSTRGTVGLCAIIGQEVLPANIDQDVARIKIEKKIVLSTVLTAYLNSKVGQDWLIRNQTGMVQQGIPLIRVREIPIPIFSKALQCSIDNVIKKADKIRLNSQYSYTSAERLLLLELGLLDWQPDNQNKNIKRFSDFQTSRRLDAEYYQPKYEKIIAKIKKQQNDTLGNLVSIKKSIEPGSDVYSETGTPFIRVADFNKFGISQPDKYLNKTFYKDNTDLIHSLYPKQETILFSKDGSVGTAYMLRENKQIITSGAILHLTVKDKQKILPDYLTLVLNSEVVQLQAERDAGGSIILHWRIDEIENVVVPLLGLSLQKRISSLMEKSFLLRSESERLLILAKEAVETAIEQGEKKALKMLEREQ
jgi:restriction endonuclease S subunit